MGSEILVVGGEEVAAFLKRKRATFRLVLFFSAIFTGALLWFDYRLMIFGIVAITLPYFLLHQVRAFEDELGAARSLSLGLGEEGVDVTTSDEEVTVPFEEIISIRLAHDHLVVVQRTRDPHQPRHFTFPGRDSELRRAGERFRERGLAVLEEPGVEGTLVKTFGSVLVMRGLSVLGAGLVLGTLVNAVRWLQGLASPFIALATALGALTALTLAALVQLTLPSR